MTALSFLVSSLIVLLAFLTHIFYICGEFKTITPHGNTNCQKFGEKFSGLEDITIDQETGIAYVSSDDRSWIRLKGSTEKEKIASCTQQGFILHYDLNHYESGNVKSMTIFNYPHSDFHPHGISFLSEEGKKFLFVVNHRRDGDAIEVFQVEKTDLFWLFSITHPLLLHLNDVAALDSRHLYASNYFLSEPGSTLGLLELASQISWSYIVHVEINWSTNPPTLIVQKAIQNIQFANGVQVSSDKKFVYVASCTGRQVHSYEVHPKDKSLTLVNTAFTGTANDNIEISPSGTLLVGAHPKLLTFTHHAENPKKLAPSQVLEIDFHNSQNVTVSELFLSQGDDLSASSVAAMWERKKHEKHKLLLIGGVFQEGLLVCKS